MKILKFAVLNLLVFGMFFTSCKQKEVKKVEVKENVTQVKVKESAAKIKEVNNSFKVQLQEVVQDYLTLKDALVKGDKSIANTAAKSALVNLGLVDMKLLSKPISHKVWMSEKPKIKEAFQKIEKDSTVALQRADFIKLSKSMIIIVENFGVNKKLMIQHCPMANDFKGANWLSSYSEIRNPYFGKKMLDCGETTKIVK